MGETTPVAKVSHQSSYLHVRTRKELFHEIVCDMMQRSRTDVSAVLVARNVSLEDRLVQAFDETYGQFVEVKGLNAEGVINACHALLGPLLEEHRKWLVENITTVVESSGRAAQYVARGITARQLASTLVATADGFAYRCRSRREFVKRMRAAVLVLCLPLPSTWSNRGNSRHSDDGRRNWRAGRGASDE
jgi:AcrR family transcriptional regulator